MNVGVECLRGSIPDYQGVGGSHEIVTDFGISGIQGGGECPFIWCVSEIV